jgi:hypothetical protein
VLLTISTTHRPATDLGWLLHKHPDRAQSFSLPFGKARVFYPEGRKRSLGAREFGLGVEALERLARAEPLYRVHECVFGVLALESEPVDPRL